MQTDTFAQIILFLGAFYYYIVRPRRYALFLGKFLLFMILFIPVFAHMVGMPDNSQDDEEQDTARDQVTISILLATSMCAAPFAIVFDHTASWRFIGLQIAAYWVVQFVLGAGLVYWLHSELTLAHGRFVLQESPGIVMRFIANLPKDGWGQLCVLVGTTWEIFTDSVARSLSPAAKEAPTLVLRRSDGRAIANITASTS